MQACCLGACWRRCLYKFQKKPVLWESEGLASCPTSATKKAV